MPAGAQERPQAADRAATHAPHTPGVSQAATGPLSASPPKENPMTRHTPDEPQDVVTALRDDLTHALGSDHLADLALRAVEPALLAVEVDTAQRMQDDVDHWRARADRAEQERDDREALRAYRDAIDALLALPDHGAAALATARDRVYGDTEAATGYPLLASLPGVMDEHKITIYAARIATETDPA